MAGLSRWDEFDLVERLCRSLDTAKRVVALFGVDGFVDAECPENSFRPEKALAETALLLYAASGAKRFDGVQARIDELLPLIERLVRSDLTLLRIALQPTLALDYSAPHILLTKLGSADSDFDQVLSACLAAQVIGSHERPPFGAIEQRWLTWLWNGTPVGLGWQRDLRNSVLNRTLDLLGGRREDSYAFTHLIMYCTNMGFGPNRLPRSRSQILCDAESLLAKCLDAEDYDLGGEVMLAWPMTGAPWSPGAAFAFQLLASIEDQIGVVPGGTTKPDRLNRSQGRERTRYALGTAYHTAYVMGMICAAALRPGRTPHRTIRGGVPDPVLLSRLQSFLEPDQGHWQGLLGQLRSDEQVVLAPFLLDIAIAQKCRKQDYAEVGQLLSIAVEHATARSPMCVQAVGLLERLSTCSEIVQLRHLTSRNVSSL